MRKTNTQAGKRGSSGLRTGYERFAALDDAAKQAEVAEYEKPFDEIEARPLSAAGRTTIRRAARKGRGRPKIGQGARRVVTTIEGGLLSRADAWAKAHQMTRAQMVALGLQKMMDEHRRAG